MRARNLDTPTTAPDVEKLRARLEQLEQLKQKNPGNTALDMEIQSLKSSISILNPAKNQATIGQASTPGTTPVATATPAAKPVVEPVKPATKPVTPAAKKSSGKTIRWDLPDAAGEMEGTTNKSVGERASALAGLKSKQFPVYTPSKTPPAPVAAPEPAKEQAKEPAPVAAPAPVDTPEDPWRSKLQNIKSQLNPPKADQTKVDPIKPYQGVTLQPLTTTQTTQDIYPGVLADIAKTAGEIQAARGKAGVEVSQSMGEQLTTEDSRRQEEQQAMLQDYLGRMDNNQKADFWNRVIQSIGKIAAGGVGLATDLDVGKNYKPIDVYDAESMGKNIGNTYATRSKQAESEASTNRTKIARDSDLLLKQKLSPIDQAESELGVLSKAVSPTRKVTEEKYAPITDPKARPQGGGAASANWNRPEQPEKKAERENFFKSLATTKDNYNKSLSSMPSADKPSTVGMLNVSIGKATNNEKLWTDMEAGLKAKGMDASPSAVASAVKAYVSRLLTPPSPTTRNNPEWNTWTREYEKFRRTYGGLYGLYSPTYTQFETKGGRNVVLPTEEMPQDQYDAWVEANPALAREFFASGEKK